MIKKIKRNSKKIMWWALIIIIISSLVLPTLLVFIELITQKR